VARLAVLTVVAAVAPQRRLQEGDEHQDDDGDEGQRDEDVLVDEEQAHFPHALARGLVNGTALQRKRAPWLCCRSMRGNVLVIAVGDLDLCHLSQLLCCGLRYHGPCRRLVRLYETEFCI